MIPILNAVYVIIQAQKSYFKKVILSLGFSVLCKLSFGTSVIKLNMYLFENQKKGYWLYYKHATGCYAICYAIHFILIIAILECVKYFTVVFISIPLITNDGEHIFTSLLTICISLEKYLLKSSAHFLIGLFVFVVRVHYIFWILEPYQIYVPQIFSPILQAVFLHS